MKSYPAAFIALTLLLGGCSSTPPSGQPATAAVPIPAGTRPTPWGELPVYDQSGHFFQNLARVPPVLLPDAAVTLDIMVNHDGSVRDVAVAQSSGNREVDLQTQAQFAHARYSLRLRPEDPAPYVVHQTIAFKTDVAQTAPPTWTTQGELGPQPNYSGPPPSNYSNATMHP